MSKDKIKNQLIRMIQSASEANIVMALLLAESQSVPLNSFLIDCQVLLRGENPSPTNLAGLFSMTELDWARRLLWLPRKAQFNRRRVLQPMNQMHPAIGWLAKLETLDLSNHAIRALPPEIGCLENLRHLILNNNQLQALPPEIAQLKKLEVLELAINQLSAFPEEISGLQQLRKLSIDFNPLKKYELDRLHHLLPYTRIEARFSA